MREVTGPYEFVKKAHRDSEPELVKVKIARESPTQADARALAYSDPRPEVTPGKPKFFRHVTSGGLCTTKQ